VLARDKVRFIGEKVAAVAADSPSAWWRLGEPVGSVVAQDQVGGHDGVFQAGVTLGVAGLIGGDPDTAASFDGSSGRVAGPALATPAAPAQIAAVVAHDLALYLPPLTADGADWRRFPVIARLVDRGDPANRTCDIGSMELYAASVIASDPFAIAGSLQATAER